MDKVPLFPRQAKNVTAADFLRNFWCPHYKVCLNEAADRDLYLDCSICMYKDTSADNYLMLNSELKF